VFLLDRYYENKQKVLIPVFKYIESRNYKVVIKAINLSQAEGVYILPKKRSDVENIVEKLIEDYKQNLVLVEDYFEAMHEYRVLLYEGKIINAYERIPAFIIGDRKYNIKDLIQEKSILRNKLGFKGITIDEGILRVLQEKATSLEDIVPENQRIMLRDLRNLSKGGEVKRIDVELFHPAYNQIFRKVYEVTGLNFMGLDLMIAGEVSDNPIRGQVVVNEINAAPGIDVTYFGDLLDNKDPFRGAQEVLFAILG
jgi:D-alanine-D-alanine ligase-like ATP-grasp enzyme